MMSHHEESFGVSRTELSTRLRLHVLTDRKLARERATLAVAAAALDGGATAIQLRDKMASTRELIETGQALRHLTHERNALLIVNDRIDIALAVDADGAHVGQDDMPAVLARRLLGPGRILGVSAATLEQAIAAESAGADYLGIGPIFATASKADAGPATGLDLLAAITRHLSLPLVAIGGISASNAARVIQAGATGIAVISAVVSAEDIAHAAHGLRLIVEKTLFPEMHWQNLSRS